jgi:hypothetical protein
MRIISTKIHGVLDYAVGVLLIAAPYLLGFANGGAAQWVPMILGVLAIGSALMTRYELGAVHLIPMPMHLMLDFMSGALLAMSPWLFGFADQVFWPHLILGVFEIGASVMTQTHSPVETGLATSVR